jgi:hypothetical protein
MWREPIVRGADSWYIFFVGCRSSLEANSERLHPIGACKVWPAGHRGGPLFSLCATENACSRLRNRVTPKGRRAKPRVPKSETNDHSSALLSPQGSGGAYRRG